MHVLALVLVLLFAELSPLPYYLQSVSLREVGNYDGAVAALEQARLIAPGDPDLALEMARTYDADRRYGDAAAAYDEAWRLAPERVELSVAQARFHLDHAFRVTVARDAAERAARLAPDDPAVVPLLDAARTAAALAADSPG